MTVVLMLTELVALAFAMECTVLMLQVPFGLETRGTRTAGCIVAALIAVSSAGVPAAQAGLTGAAAAGGVVALRVRRRALRQGGEEPEAAW